MKYFIVTSLLTTHLRTEVINNYEQHTTALLWAVNEL